MAVVGATGAVGSEMLRVLAERRFPVERLHLLASRRSAGRRIPTPAGPRRVEVLSKRAFEGIDIALFSAGAARSLEFAPEAVRRGAMVVDNSSAFRLHQGVPLVVPEVNAHALYDHQGLIANPNCSTIIMLMVLKPLHDAARLRRITVATYQSVSGAGAMAMVQLHGETMRVLRQLKFRGAAWDMSAKLARHASQQRAALPAQIAFNVIPQVDVFLKDGYTKEEVKLSAETRKILEDPSLAISATCVRVPVLLGHSEAIWIETQRPLSPAGARRVLTKAPGVRVVDRLIPGGYPMPIEDGHGDDVCVGRIRADAAVPNGLALWVSGDNLRKGAATNAIQIAELLVNRRR